MVNIDNALSNFPRACLQQGPTPLERLNRISNHLGIDLWIKRDDLTGLGFGGNKVRQLEFYLGAAQAKGADTILITGAVQSNYVRTAAAAAAKLGLAAVLQLEDRVPGKGETYRKSGNVLLGQMLGAEYMHYPHGEDEAGADQALRQKADQLRAKGHVPYVIPLGLNNPPLGALGYMVAAREVLAQKADFDAIVIASGSGMTHGGMLAGLRTSGSNIPVYGICVRRNRIEQQLRIKTVTDNIATLVQGDLGVTESDINTWDNSLAPGYGLMGPLAQKATDMMAHMEGLFLDPVYTAKTFAGVLGLLTEGVIRPGMRVLFVHTGGSPALFAYQ